MLVVDEASIVALATRPTEVQRLVELAANLSGLAKIKRCGCVSDSASGNDNAVRLNISGRREAESMIQNGICTPPAVEVPVDVGAINSHRGVS